MPLEHVELRNGQAAQAVESYGTVDDDHIQPPAAARSSRGRSELAALLANPLPDVVEEFRRKGPLAHAGGICFNDADHAADARRADSGSRAGVSRDRVG